MERTEHDIVTVTLEEWEPDPAFLVHAVSNMGGRSSQQDTVFVEESPNKLLAVVCDGMGGMKGGEQASMTAARVFAERYLAKPEEQPVPEFLAQTAKTMDEAVFELEEEGKPLGAGSTVVAAMFTLEGLYWLSVGDSKLYLARKGAIVCPVPEHNYKLLLGERLMNGSISMEHYESELPRGEALISFLGMGAVSRMEINELPFQLQTGDQILLCSDGLYKSLSETRINQILNGRRSTREKAEQLVEEALLQGGASQDNTSVILIQYQGRN